MVAGRAARVVAVCVAVLVAACTDAEQIAVPTVPLGPTVTESSQGTEPPSDDTATSTSQQQRPTLPALPAVPPPPPPPDPVTVLATGNMSDCGQRDAEVAALVDRTDGTIVSTGDLAPFGTEERLAECFLPLYGDDLGRLVTVPGDNDLATDDGAAFYDIAARSATPSEIGKGWFVTTLGAWQVIGLNSRCVDVGGCDVGSEQYLWLDSVLRSEPAECRLAIWHDPRFTSADGVADARDLGALYGRLDGAGVDVVITGGPANYERLGPLRPSGEPAEVGVVNFNVGIGGAGRTHFGDDPKDGSVVRLAGVDGVVLMELSADGYRWELLVTPESAARSGSTPTDEGSGTC